MLNKIIFCAGLVVLTSYGFSQRIKKVSRKGMKPMVVNNAGNSSSYSLQQFNGKWQEVSRVDRLTNSGVSFNDTLFYNFSGNSVKSRDGVNMSLTGEAAIDEGNVLVAAADVFIINSLTPSRVILDDGERYIHTLIKKKNFWHETLPNKSVVPETFVNPVAINLSAILGKWKVYRRNAKPGTWTNGQALIRSLEIKNDNGDNTATGEITFYQTEKLQTVPCNITLMGDKIILTTEKNKWELNIYKADGNEFVFGSTSLMYYSKPVL